MNTHPTFESAYETNNIGIYNQIYPRLFTQQTPSNMGGAINPYNPLIFSFDVSDHHFTIRHCHISRPLLVSRMDEDDIADDAPYWYSQPSLLSRIRDAMDELELLYELGALDGVMDSEDEDEDEDEDEEN